MRRRSAVLALTAVVTGAVTGMLTAGLDLPAHAEPFTAAADTGATVAGRQAERLGRGLVSVRSGDANLVSWRLLGTDPSGVGFEVFRDGVKITPKPLTGGTGLLDRGAPAGASYTVRAVVGSWAEWPSARSLTFRDGHLDVPLRPPAPAGGRTWSANDASVGDLDGDGELDLVLKWDPSDSKDNSQPGTTGNVYVDGLKLDGTRLWRIDLGRNVRAGAHYTQVQVFDYDGDGRAEVAMRTSDGTRDGAGTVLGSAGADHRNADGYVLSGPEHLTVFDGRTGAARASVPFAPARGKVTDWGDDYGNRVDRFLAGTAYLDGVRPSLVVSRGYYAKTALAAYDFRDGRLTRRWSFDSATAGPRYAGQGNHQLSVADVDADGRDEIVFGAMAVDDDGRGLWSTGNGHGDAQHVADLLPDRPGLEVFKVDEDPSKPSSYLADARTGQVLWTTPPAGDNGRGVAADIWAGNPGAEAWSAAGSEGLLSAATGRPIGRKPSSANFVVWWDGDVQRELLDRNRIDDYGPQGETRLLTAQGAEAGNGSKMTPALSGDILGDWREEVVWRTPDSSALRIYSTPVPTDRRNVTLLHDSQYRLALAWQNTAYNQPPHPRTAPR